MTAQDRLQPSKVYLFKPAHERVYFFFLFSFLMLSFAIFFDLIKIPDLTNRWWRVLVAFVFFNALHTMLTFLGLAALPELRALVKAQFRPIRFLTITAILMAIIYGAMSQMNLDAPLDRVVTSVLALLVALHNLSQLKGLSLLYNRQVQSLLAPDELVRQQNAERTERYLFDSLLLIKAAIAVGLAVFRPYLHGWFFAILHSLFAILCGVLILNALRYPKLFSSKKLWLLQGLWIFAIIPAHPSVLALQMCLHGLEYVFLSDVMLKRTALKPRRGLVFTAFFVLTAFAIVKTLAQSRFSHQALEPWLVWTVMSAATIIEYGHYYLDSIIFRFKDPAVRAHIAPLLPR